MVAFSGMWSSVSLPGPPRILMADITQDYQGWEHEFFDRLCNGLQRSELQIVGGTPFRFKYAAELIGCLNDFDFNCLLLFALAKSQHNGLDSTLSDFWDTLRSEGQSLPILLAVCSCLNFDPRVSEDILKSNPAITPLAIAPQSSMNPREAGLFYLKFFTELKLHSEDSISGKMVWFSFSKARELLRRRRYNGKFGVRC